MPLVYTLFLLPLYLTSLYTEGIRLITGVYWYMSDDLNVLMLGWEYPPHNTGGLGVACEGLTQALFDQGQQIYFTLPYNFSQNLGHMDVLSVPVGFDKNGKPVTAPPFGAYKASIATGRLFNAQDLRNLSYQQISHQVDDYAKSISKTIQAQKIQSDVIHAHDWMTYPAAQYLKKQTNQPFVAHVHSTEFDRVPNGNGNQFIHQAEFNGLQGADRVIAVSELTKQILIDRYDIDADKIEVIHNGIEGVEPVRTPEFAQGRPVVVFMGRLTMQKGAEYFLQLAKKVVTQVPEALFVVAGQGDQYSMLLLENAKQGLSSSVIFAGFLRGEQKDMLLSRADVFVMPSVSEPFGLVALEAVQRETPVIISKTSGVKEVLPGAISVDFWDTDLMVKEITHLLQDKNYYKQVLDEQMKNLNNVSWDQAAEKVKAVYQRILDQHN
jgi:glycogen synthase